MFVLSVSIRKNKKYMIETPSGKKIHFGDSRYQDFTKHKDMTRKKRYILRHRGRENWTKSGINTPGFWSRWLLWNKPTIQASILDIERRFKIKLIRTFERPFEQI